MKGLLGKKIGMTQLFSPTGKLLPVTVVKAGPCRVLQKKTQENDGYWSIQLGFEEIKNKRRIKKPLLGHCQKANARGYKFIREIRLTSSQELAQYKVGEEIKVNIFKEGNYVDVQGISKGKGFQGVMKRHGFKGGRASRGSMFHRAPGSIGSSSTPSRVWRGKRLPGRMGGRQVTIQNLEVNSVDKERDLLLLKGSIPGPRGGYLIIKEAVKKKGK
jgi:large subunit ribosomal protein L3